MDQDRDISALLPKAPRPRPDRREAAIDEALRRFDGTEARRAAPPPRPADAWWKSPWRRPQFGLALATALVAVIAVPVWMVGDHRLDRNASDLAAPALAPPAAPGLVVPSPVTASPPSPALDHLDSASPAPAPPAILAEDDAPTEAAAKAMRREPASGGTVESEAGLADFAAAPAAAPPPPPPPAIVMQEAAPAGAAKARMPLEDIVVTARARSEGDALRASAPRLPRARSTSRRGDWNACTINDPARNLEACRPQGAAGLAQAWQGDIDGAITELDRAITASPQSGAYLNRGLAYDRKGERDRALADLDRAVRRAPDSARAYYNRSLVLRRMGQRDRAAADAARAIELDPAYRAVVE